MTTTFKPAKEITIEYIMGMTDTKKSAIIVIEYLKHFLLTQEDRQEFISRWLDGYTYHGKRFGIAMIHLAQEIGAYHYEYEDLEQLELMEPQKALERLFLQPINYGAMLQFKESGASLKRLYELKQANPKYYFMEVLMYV
ncbi:hypothetical protein KDC22_13230 [Paenibacillus tritici]|uniref:hypothetical protein n=1 Tax=Paenibacillus tritici TaxID=1873425 RepID=UPI001BAC8E42|nr:hypothetical protein [Paenibacillus tritici]QUL57340.1 hypothetical protein KDC22_13230 [Paenibacillus tritici]